MDMPMRETSFLATLPATTTPEPNSLPFLYGFNGIDLLATLIVFFGLLFLYGIVEERYLHRRKRWKSNQDLDRILELRKNLEGFDPPEQKHARNRKEAA